MAFLLYKTMKISNIKYERIDVSKLNSAYITGANKIKSATSVGDVLTARDEVVKVAIELDTAYNLAFIRWSQNVKDEFYLNEKRYYEENMPTLIEAEKEYKKAIIDSPFLSELKKKLPYTLFEVFKCDLNSKSFEVEKELVKESELSNEYSNLLSSLTFDFDGEKLPLTLIKGYMQSPDRATRIKAYNSLGLGLKENANKLDGIFDELVKVRNQIAIKQGYTNFVKIGYMRMNRVSYGEKEIEILRNAVIKYVVPAVTRIKNELAKKIGVYPLKIYDYDAFFPSLSTVPNYSGEALIKKAEEMYEKISDETGEFFKFMLASEAFDCLSRTDKWGGGYETELKKYDQPFILANFNSTSDDVDVLTHELGHAFASYVFAKENKDLELGLPFMETAETHSMTMEFLAHPYIDVFFGNNAKNYRLKHLIDSFTFIPYGTMVDAFQEEVYKAPSLTPSERKELWNHLEKTFRPFMTADGVTYLEEGTRWQYQMHIYESPFYYIDYVLAQLSALNFYLETLSDYEEAFKKYRDFISLGCDYGYFEALDKVGLQSPLNEETVKDLAEKVENIIMSELKKLG